jgi:predicted anti-sigma-YlaC factor YlaD
MLCSEFEDRLTDYLDGTLNPVTNSDFAQHALRCPVCHDLLNEVKNALQACSIADVPAPPYAELEARIMRSTVPQFEMTCEEFEEHLTDYLDGFLPAPLFHRWERHAALCSNCTDLPGQVVRSIGACYTYINIENPVPIGLHERILQSTLGTVHAENIKAPLGARIAEWLRSILDPIVSPQYATVASMLLVAVIVMTNTISADGSIGGMYRSTVKLAEQAYEQGIKPTFKGVQMPNQLENIPINTYDKSLDTDLKKIEDPQNNKQEQKGQKNQKQNNNEQKK